MQIKDELFLAIQDYSYLIERNYSINSVIKIVGDRYRLNSIERHILLRGITQKQKLLNRKNKIVDEKYIENKNVHIDGYNLIFTISNYFNGNFCFLAMDGFIRDCANIGGRNKKNLNFEKFSEMVFEFQKVLKPSKIFIYLDEPVSMSKDDADKLKKLLEKNKSNKNNENFEILVVKNPDSILTEVNLPDVVCTSDSIILDKANAFIFDIIRWYFENKDIKVFSIEDLGC